MLDIVKQWCFVIATLDGIGNWQGAPFWIMICALPCVVGSHFMRLAVPGFFYGFTTFLFFLIIAIIAGALQYQKSATETSPSSPIVIDELVGYVVAFIGVALSVKLLIVGMFLVLGTRFALPRLFPLYFTYSQTFSTSTCMIILDDLIAGIVTNFFFAFTFWLAR